jgi:exonuclease VII large subunit
VFKALAFVLSTSYLSFSACIPVDQALSKIGSTTCVTGKVAKITQGDRGVQYIDFCNDHAQCAFSGVVFANDLRDVGDIRSLTGKTIEIHGKLREYENHAEIIVSEARQLRGDGVSLLPVPKAYDVEERGHFSAGSARHPKKPKKTKKMRRQPLPAGGVEVPEDEQQP